MTFGWNTLSANLREQKNSEYFLPIQNNPLNLQQSNSMLTLYIGITGRIFNRAESPIGLKEGRHIYIKGVTDALVLTVYELRNFKPSVKNKATETPQGV